MESVDKGSEERLAGGHITGAVRVGNTVRRPTGPWSPAVHALLIHLESVGFEGAPRFLGLDEQGREILEFISGEVPGLEPSLFGSEQIVFEVGALIRLFHEAMASFVPPRAAVWRYRSEPSKDGAIICHGDLVPWNTVTRNGMPVAFIDWDMAQPDLPISDVVYAIVHFVPLHDDDRCRSLGWEHPPLRGPRLRAFCDGYGLASRDSRTLLDEAIRRMRKVHDGLKAGAEAGDPTVMRLWEEGVGELPLRDIRFIENHRAQLEPLLS